MAEAASKTEEEIMAVVQQEYKILAEYKMVGSEKIGGMYVIPSYGSSLLWYGVLFVRQGFYEDGVFRFTILLPKKFPDDKVPPTVTFQSEIFHPLVAQSSGLLDISYAFPHWRAGEDHIWQLLKYVQAVFIDPLECTRLTATASWNNAEAADLLTQNRTEFMARVKDCVALSKERIYDEPPTDDPHYITFEKFKPDVHGSIKDRILSGKEPTPSTASAGAKGLSWVKEGEYTPLSADQL